MLVQSNELAHNWSVSKKLGAATENRMTKPENLSHDELVEFANLIYGSQWRDALAKHLKISRKQLVLTLAAGNPIPEFIALPVIDLMESYLRDQEETQRILSARLAEIRGRTAQTKQPRVSRQSAS